MKNKLEWLWYDYLSSWRLLNNLFCQAVGEKGSRVTSWHRVTGWEAVCELLWWSSLLKHVTRQHKTNLNGFGMTIWVCKGCLMICLIMHTRIGGSKVNSLWCIMVPISTSLRQKSLLEYVTRWHEANLNRFGMTTSIRKGWSMIWFVEHTGEKDSRVNFSQCVMVAIGASHQRRSLHKHVSGQHKTNLNGHCYDS
jgi:hypothetical protein